MHLFELKIGAFGCGHGHAQIIDLLVELIQDLVGDDGLEAVDDAVLILLRVVVVLVVAVQEPEPLLHVVAVGHVDQPEELILVVNWIGRGVHM